MLEKAKAWARAARRDVAALGIAVRDPRVPWYAKAVAAFVVAYALSPIDLIPDFIPVVGYLDDLVIVPLGILLSIRLVPSELMQEFRERAAELESEPASYFRAAVVAVLWIAALALAAWWLWPHLGGKGTSSSAVPTRPTASAHRPSSLSFCSAWASPTPPNRRRAVDSPPLVAAHANAVVSAGPGANAADGCFERLRDLGSIDRLG